MAELLCFFVLACVFPCLATATDLSPNESHDAALQVCSHCSACLTVPRNKFAIYSYNFGNYRDELNGMEEEMAALASFDVDCFFFTDDFQFNPVVEGWKIVHVPTRMDEHGIPGTRLNGKDIKFKGHPVLDLYEYHIHVDASANRIILLMEWLANGLLHHVLSNPQTTLFISTHPSRKTTSEEIARIRWVGYQQPIKPLDAFTKFLRPVIAEVDALPLAWGAIFVRNNHDVAFKTAFMSIPDLLIEHGLYRDQIMFWYALREESKKVGYLDPKEGLKPFRHCNRRMYIDLGSGKGDSLQGLHTHYDECHASEPNPELYAKLREQNYPKCGIVNFRQDLHNPLPSTNLAVFLRSVPLDFLIVLNVDAEGFETVLMSMLENSPLTLRRVSFMAWGPSLQRAASDVKMLETALGRINIVVCGGWCAHNDPFSSKKWKTAHKEIQVAKVHKTKRDPLTPELRYLLYGHSDLEYASYFGILGSLCVCAMVCFKKRIRPVKEKGDSTVTAQREESKR